MRHSEGLETVELPERMHMYPLTERSSVPHTAPLA